MYVLKITTTQSMISDYPYYKVTSGEPLCPCSDSKDGSRRAYSVLDFVSKVDMRGKVLVALELPGLDKMDRFRSFKITPRSQVVIMMVVVALNRVILITMIIIMVIAPRSQVVIMMAVVRFEYSHN